MSQNFRLSEVIQCKKCSNKAPFKVVAEYSKKDLTYENGKFCSEYGRDYYELLLCPACSSITLRSYYWHDYMDGADIRYKSLYPVGNSQPLGLPPDIQIAYNEAMKVKPVNINSYAVQIGRVLDMICKDRNASGNTLYAKLASLSKKGEIPINLVKVAENLRHFRNIGAHAELGDLKKSEEPLLSSLLRALLEYIYSAPYLVQEAEDKLKILKDSSQ